MLVSYEFVKKYVADTGYKLITTKDEYINTKVEIAVRCTKGHEYNIKWHHFKEGGRCGRCQNVARFPLADVVKYAAGRSYKLLTKEYKNNRQDIDFICEHGHPFTMSLKKFKNCNIPCEICRKQNNKWRLKYNYVDVNTYIENKGCALLTKEEEYINTRKNLDIKCCKGHIFPMDFHTFKQDHGCPECGRKSTRDALTFSYEYVKNYIEVESGSGYTLISREYRNSHTPLIIMCSKGHKYSVYFDSFKNAKHRCRECLGLTKLDGNFVYNEFINRGLLPTFRQDDYKNNYTRLPYICLKHKDKGIQCISIDSLNRAMCGCFYCGYEKVSECMKGENHPQWKGGITDLHHKLRSATTKWRSESLRANDYKCILTGESSKDIEVHHLIGFGLILQKILNDCGFNRYKFAKEYTFDEYAIIEKNIIEEHKKLLGVPITSDIHRLFHSLYGTGDTMPQQFEEFKQRFYKGEFNNVLQLNIIDGTLTNK